MALPRAPLLYTSETMLGATVMYVASPTPTTARVVASWLKLRVRPAIAVAALQTAIAQAISLERFDRSPIPAYQGAEEWSTE
jgi:hypothetical protein